MLKSSTTGGTLCTVHHHLAADGKAEAREECPYEPGVLIDAAKMQAHLKVCPTRVRLDLMKAQPFYKFNVNMPHERPEIAQDSDFKFSIEQLESMYGKIRDKYITEHPGLFTVHEQVEHITVEMERFAP